MSILLFIWLTIFAFAGAGSVAYIFERKNEKFVTIYHSDKKDGWLDISENPLPDDISYYLASDGKRIKFMIGVEYDKNGNPLFFNFPGEKTLIKYWQPLPLPPETKK